MEKLIMTKVYRTLIVDDHPSMRSSWRMVLDTEPCIQVIGEAANGVEAIKLVSTDPPDAILMDIQMPVMDGLVATRLIKARWPHIRVVLISLDASLRQLAAQAGADDFLVKSNVADCLARLTAAICAPGASQ
jgi:DNA-binding NarL/FixJ family response regulator